MIIVFGNSITQGAFDDECGGWVNRLAAHYNGLFLKGKQKTQVANLGISGEDILGIKSRFKHEFEARIKKDRDDILILAVGVNDSKVHVETKENKTPLPEYKKALEEMIQEATEYPNIRVFCVGLLPVDDSLLDPIPWNQEYAYRNSEVEKYSEVIQDIAQQEGATFIPMQDIFGKNHQGFLIDGIHPNAEGHKLMFERVKKYLNA